MVYLTVSRIALIVNMVNLKYFSWYNHNLVLIDQQSVGQRSLYLMNTINAKKR
jgi:hypothetical protein